MNSSTTALSVHPRLLVSDGDAALEFYAAVFEAETLSCHRDDAGKIVNADIRIGTTDLSLTEGDGEMNTSPTDLGGTSVILSVECLDVDARAAQMVEAGGEVLIPVDDRFYGRRDGRLRDPFGHLWILGQPLAKGPSVDT